MRIWLVRAAWTIGVLIGLPIAIALWLYEISDTSFGRHALERLIKFGSGGEVAIQGLAGTFPSHLRMAHIDVSDTQGVWLRADDVTLNWTPAQLLHNEARVAVLNARRADMLRMPISNQPTTKSTFRSNVRQFSISRLDVEPALAGRRVSLTLQGGINYVSTSDVGWSISARQIGGSGVYSSGGSAQGKIINARINVREPPGSFLSGVAGLPGLGTISLDANLVGSRAGEAL